MRDPFGNRARIIRIAANANRRTFLGGCRRGVFLVIAVCAAFWIAVFEMIFGRKK